MIILLAFFNIWPAHLKFWQYRDGKLQAVDLFMPLYPPVNGRQERLSPSPQKNSGDLNNDGQNEYLCQSDGQATLQPLPCEQNSQPLWQSPPQWTVKQASLADLNHDGKLEAVLLVWRPFRSWPVDEFLPYPGRIKDFHDSRAQSCHVILIGWTERGYRERWAGSAMARPLLAFSVADVDGNGYDDIIALEGQYDHAPPAAYGSLTAWEWNGFGFTLLARTNGPYSQFSTLPRPGLPAIILAE